MDEKKGKGQTRNRQILFLTGGDKKGSYGRRRRRRSKVYRGKK